MNLGKLLKRLRRDLTANPKKAALLGLMVLVACYFWAPLVMDGLGMGGKRKTTASTDQLILTDDPIDASQPVRSAKMSLRWDRVQQWIAADALMTPAKLNVNWRDPFAGPVVPPTVERAPDPTIEAAVVAPPEVPETTPGAAGLVLQSVLVGPKRKVATISGRMYRAGDTVPRPEVGQPAAADFKIKRIFADGVELERGGKTYLLTFDQVELSEAGEIVRTSREKAE